VNADKPNTTDWYATEVHVHRDALRAWLKDRFPAVSDPDNLVQEALRRVWRMGDAVEVRTARALLFATAKNLALDELRRRRIATIEPLTELDDLLVYEEGPDPAETAAHHQELELLTQAIQSLPDRCRQVLTLRKIYGLPQKEIARQLGIAEHTVEAHVAAGMRRCAEFLHQRGML
jgi:RNA polymerase sigma factor (sigma-70 family)